MPYRSQGIVTAEDCKKIELSYLTKNNLIKNNSFNSGILSWNCRGENSGRIKYEIVFNDTEKYIKLSYSKTNRYTNENKDFDYKVYLLPVKSNLGIGNVFYFQCPVSFQKCRILYMAYGSDYFKCSKAYKNRIYYNIQTVSKRFYHFQRYFDLEKLLEKIYYKRKCFKETYRGQETRAYRNIKIISNKMNFYDNKKLIGLKTSLKKLKKF